MSAQEKDRPYHVLIVDDEEDIDILTKQRFRKEIQAGLFAFYFARNGQDALDEIARRGVIDVIMTDVNMPQMDGFELLAKVRTRYPNIKTVMISAYSDQQSMQAALNGGACAFISKPLDFGVLQQTLRDLCP
ncbi:MAG: response regulator [Proteobacteria bacterium]|nr:response regulator [Pseudomonadota bacterium]